MYSIPLWMVLSEKCVIQNFLHLFPKGLERKITNSQGTGLPWELDSHWRIFFCCEMWCQRRTLFSLLYFPPLILNLVILLPECMTSCIHSRQGVIHTCLCASERGAHTKMLSWAVLCNYILKLMSNTKKLPQLAHLYCIYSDELKINS